MSVKQQKDFFMTLGTPSPWENQIIFVLIRVYTSKECSLFRVFLFYLNWMLCPYALFDKIKQFVITNCSKERFGSIVTETLKNGILIPIATSKESYFNVDFKYISFIRFFHQKLRVWENLRVLMKITPSDSAYQRTLL